MRLSLLTFPLLLAPVEALQPGADDLDKRLTELTTAAEARGLAVVIDVGGERVFGGASGRMHFGGNAPMRVDRAVPAACLMDLFTALLALRLVDEGTLDPELPLSTYVDGLAWEGQRVTLHHLLTHTSGVPAIEHVEAQLAAVAEVFQREATWKLVTAEPLLDAPGTCQTFSGTNTYLAGKVLESVTGKPFGEQVRSALFEPLDLAGTGHDPDAGEVDEAGCEVDFAGTLATDASAAARFGAAQLVTTAEDLAALVRGLADKRIVSRRAWAHLVGTHRLDDGEELGYAHGLSRTTLDAFEGFAFGGANGHERLYVAHYPGLDLTIALTADCDAGLLPALAERLAREVFDLPLPQVADRPLPAGALTLYVGEYSLGCDRVTLRATEDGHLFFSSAGRRDHRLLFQGAHGFVAEDDHGFALQFQVDEGLARTFVLSERGVASIVVRTDR